MLIYPCNACQYFGDCPYVTECPYALEVDEDA